MKISTAFSTVFISTEIQKIFLEVFQDSSYTKIFILLDENTKKYCFPIIQGFPLFEKSIIIEIESGEINKSLQSLEKIWSVLTQSGADRSSVFINLGGGIIGDMGGFAASTFKRGMPFINIPTTLLSQVDASIGGKTGINFLGLKNEIGVFSHPSYVIIDSSFNRTLDKRNILSGWAEMLKHALIFNEDDWRNLILKDIKQIGFKELNHLIARSISIKNHFVDQDPKEKGIRKALNFGHSFGHAFESLFMNSKSKILHGEAVAHGIICEIYLSNKICGFPKDQMNEIASYILKTYEKINFQDSHNEQILELLVHDKKNVGEQVNFTLLENYGEIKINQHCSREQIIETLNWYKTL